MPYGKPYFYGISNKKATPSGAARDNKVILTS